MKIEKDDLLALTAKLIRERGYHNTSMGDVAAAAGLSKATLYSRFANKADLATAALQHEMDALADRLPTSDDPKKDYETAVNGIAELLLQTRRCIGLHLLYGLEGTTENVPVRSFFTGLHRYLEDRLATLLPRDLASDHARRTISELEGAAIWLLVDDDRTPMLRAVTRLKQRAHDLAAPSDNPRIHALLSDLGVDALTSSHAAQKLAERLLEAEADLLTTRAALAGQIEAESCFK